MSKSLFDILFFFVKSRSKYDEIARDESRRTDSVYFGVRSIVNSIIFGAMIAASAFGVSYFVGFLSQSVIIGTVMIIVFAALALISFVYFIFGGLMFFVYQLKLNKRPIGYIAIAVWAVFLAGGAVVAIVFGGLL